MRVAADQQNSSQRKRPPVRGEEEQREERIIMPVSTGGELEVRRPYRATGATPHHRYRTDLVKCVSFGLFGCVKWAKLENVAL